MTLVYDKKLSIKKLTDLVDFGIDFVKNEGKDHFYTQLETIRTLSYQFKERDFPGNKYCEMYEACLDNVIRIII